MHKLASVCVLALLLVVAAFCVPLVQAAGPVEMIVYFSPTCSHCTIVREQVLPALSQTFGAQLQITLVDVTQPQGLKQLEDAEARLKQQSELLPVIQVGDRLISEEDPVKLQAMLTQLVRESLGASAPSGTQTAATPSGASSTAGVQTATINLAYVQKDGCEKCARAQVVLDVLQKEYPALTIRAFNNVRDAKTLEAMGAQLGLPQTERLVAPAIYVGRDALVNDEVTSTNVRALLDKYAATGAPAFWEGLDVEAGENSILSRFQTMGPLAVVLAAAIDGINPCAFATIIFFVSYLAISRRPRRDMIVVGLAFSLGVFITYFLVGLGAMSLLRLANAFRVVGLVLYGAMTLSCFVFAGLSAYDYFLARQGRLHEMSLNLPNGLRERIKGRLRSTSTAFLGAALVSGFVVSLLELACTGQVYLPTISFVVGIPQMRIYAIGYLLLYNLIFVTPLIAVLFLAVYGLSAARLQDWFVRNAAGTKLIMVVMFLLLGGLLLTQVLGLI